MTGTCIDQAVKWEACPPRPARNNIVTWLVEISAKSYKATMAQMNISIPDQLKGWVESRVAEGRYSSTSDYVRDLVRRDQEAEEARRRLKAAIEEGLASGVTDTTIDDIIARGRARHGLK
jgi:antitoxin ParD1/3/4